MKQSCEGKKPYKNMNHANFDAKRVREKYNSNANCYICIYCHHIHVGSSGDGSYNDKLKYFKYKRRKMFEVME